MYNEDEKLIIGISHGDINGISYEVIIKSLSDPRILEFFTPVLYGSSKVAAYHRKALNLPNLSLNNIKTLEDIDHSRINVVNCVDDYVRVELGKSTEIAGKASYMALKRAVSDLKKGCLEVLVTAPINKANIQSQDFNFAGHTDYLAKEFGVEDTVMLMVSENIKIGVVTTHIPIAKVAEVLTVDKIMSKLRILNNSLRDDFLIRKPVIAVLGLNPHAGDDGLIGTEEQDIIKPAIEQARREGIMALGPYPADGFFGTSHYKKFDAVLAMYHDQGLTPFKILAFDRGVNYTAGLPVIRTSPVHGTAYDIVGKGIANHRSFREALYLAYDIYKNRKMMEGIIPLEKQEISTTDIPDDIDDIVDMEENNQDV